MTIDYDQFSDVELRVQVVKVLWYNRYNQSSTGSFQSLPVVTERLESVHPDSSGVASMLGVPISKLTDSHLLSLVKRAIENRGWRWRCAAYSGGSLFIFRVSMQTDPDWDKPEEIGFASCKTEERAGYIAFLRTTALSEE